MKRVAPHVVAKVELGEVVSQIRVSAIPGELPAETPFIGLEDIAPQEGQIISLSQVSRVRSRVSQFRDGDVLYGRLRPYLRKAAVADFDGSASGEIIVIRCSERILPRYLLTLLLSEDFTQFVNARSKGDRPRTSFATIASYQLDLLSIEAQSDICDRDSRLVATVSKLAEAQVRLECAAASLMDTMRSRLIWDAEEAKLVPLADLVESIDYGTTHKSTYAGVGTPVLRIPNIGPSGEIDVRDLKYASLSRREAEQYRLKAGDILLIRSNGSLSLVGRAAKATRDHEDCAFAGYLLRMRPKNGVMSDYLLELVRSTPFRRLVETAARSTTGINNLSASRLAAFSVPLLPLKRQDRVTDTLARLQRVVTSSSKDLRQVWSSAKALHEAARRGWLGHTASQVPERLINTTREEPRIKSDHVEAGNLSMDEDIETVVLRRLEAMPFRASSFETLSEGLQADYDALRDAVFKLLAMEPPRLVQVFDEQSRSIILRLPE